MRAKVSFEENNGKDCIIVTELPYQVNKADMISKTAELVNSKKLKEFLILETNLIEMV